MSCELPALELPRVLGVCPFVGKAQACHAGSTLLLLSRSCQHRFFTVLPVKVMPMVLGLPVSHKALCTRPGRKAFSQRVAVVAGFGEDIRKALDSLAFERWAPRSSRAWRLGGDPIARQRDAAAAGGCLRHCLLLL